MIVYIDHRLVWARAVKGKTIKDNPYLVCLNVEPFDSEDALIYLDKSKALNTVDHRFQQSALSADVISHLNPVRAGGSEWGSIRTLRIVLLP